MRLASMRTLLRRGAGRRVRAARAKISIGMMCRRLRWRIAVASKAAVQCFCIAVALHVDVVRENASMLRA
jgi:hypothetical protein